MVEQVHGLTGPFKNLQGHGYQQSRQNHAGFSNDFFMQDEKQRGCFESIFQNSTKNSLLSKGIDTCSIHDRRTITLDVEGGGWDPGTLKLGKRISLQKCYNDL
jgi:hypothetical protein